MISATLASCMRKRVRVFGNRPLSRDGEVQQGETMHDSVRRYMQLMFRVHPGIAQDVQVAQPCATEIAQASIAADWPSARDGYRLGAFESWTAKEG